MSPSETGEGPRRSGRKIRPHTTARAGEHQDDRPSNSSKALKEFQLAGRKSWGKVLARIQVENPPREASFEQEVIYSVSETFC